MYKIKRSIQISLFFIYTLINKKLFFLWHKDFNDFNFATLDSKELQAQKGGMEISKTYPLYPQTVISLFSSTIGSSQLPFRESLYI